ncbi:MAG: hypothetical protein ACLQVX_13370 [Limisphaerales bacterium]
MKHEALSISTPLPGLRIHSSRHTLRALAGIACTALAFFAPAGRLCADQVEMQNGDRYAGTVLSVDSNSVVLRSDVLGEVSLPRTQVALITLGPAAARANAARSRASSTNEISRLLRGSGSRTNSELAALLRQLAGDTNSLRQVQEQVLGQAGPEANVKFNQMLKDLTSGKMTVNDLRAQAKAAADQVRGQRSELNGELGGLLDGYMAVLDNFLEETAPQEGAVTNKLSR